MGKTSRTERKTKKWNEKKNEITNQQYKCNHTLIRKSKNIKTHMSEGRTKAGGE